MYNNSNSRPGRGQSRGSSQGGGRGKPNFRGGGRSGGGGSRRGGFSRGKTIDPKRFVKAAKPVETTEYTPVNSFSDFAMSNILKENLAKKGFEKPTQIQDKAIPVALEGKDVIGIANTGTGKTAAFLLPLFEKMMKYRGEKILIVAPTRELALQIQQEARSLGKGTRLHDALLIGGAPIGRQLQDLKHRPEIIIGTPGRIQDHIERRTLRLDDVSSVVLDEVDRMLDMGFVNDVRAILSELPTERQSLFFSATMSRTIEDLIKSFTFSPVSIMARTAETSDNVEQSVVKYRMPSEKIEKLHDILNADNVKRTIIFCETKRQTERLGNELTSRGFSTDAMHGNKSQGQRQRALRKFKNGEIKILVATDVAARGIDVDDITHVINYDVPQTYDDYTHRIGRTGRGDKTGIAITFVN
ncbi:DEAD/DEAH box helicase [Candidatus Saccharibacteria bacterium]|nr:DEAD/DEAH box helicase [Candidatus Saccharibacteria bacterium]